MLFSISTFRFSGQVQDFKTVFSIVNNPNFPFREAFPDFVIPVAAPQPTTPVPSTPRPPSVVATPSPAPIPTTPAQAPVDAQTSVFESLLAVPAPAAPAPPQTPTATPSRGPATSTPAPAPAPAVEAAPVVIRFCPAVRGVCAEFMASQGALETLLKQCFEGWCEVIAVLPHLTAAREPTGPSALPPLVMQACQGVLSIASIAAALPLMGLPDRCPHCSQGCLPASTGAPANWPREAALDWRLGRMLTHFLAVVLARPEPLVAWPCPAPLAKLGPVPHTTVPGPLSPAAIESLGECLVALWSITLPTLESIHPTHAEHLRRLAVREVFGMLRGRPASAPATDPATDPLLVGVPAPLAHVALSALGDLVRPDAPRAPVEAFVHSAPSCTAEAALPYSPDAPLAPLSDFLARLPVLPGLFAILGVATAHPQLLVGSVAPPGLFGDMAAQAAAPSGTPASTVPPAPMLPKAVVRAMSGRSLNGDATAPAPAQVPAPAADKAATSFSHGYTHILSSALRLLNGPVLEAGSPLGALACRQAHQHLGELLALLTAISGQAYPQLASSPLTLDLRSEVRALAQRLCQVAFGAAADAQATATEALLAALRGAQGYPLCVPPEACQLVGWATLLQRRAVSLPPAPLPMPWSPPTLAEPAYLEWPARPIFEASAIAGLWSDTLAAAQKALTGPAPMPAPPGMGTEMLGVEWIDLLLLGMLSPHVARRHLTCQLVGVMNTCAGYLTNELVECCLYLGLESDSPQAAHLVSGSTPEALLTRRLQRNVFQRPLKGGLTGAKWAPATAQPPAFITSSGAEFVPGRAFLGLSPESPASPMDDCCLYDVFEVPRLLHPTPAVRHWLGDQCAETLPGLLASFDRTLTVHGRAALALPAGCSYMYCLRHLMRLLGHLPPCGPTGGLLPAWLGDPAVWRGRLAGREFGALLHGVRVLFEMLYPGPQGPGPALAPWSGDRDELTRQMEGALEGLLAVVSHPPSQPLFFGTALTGRAVDLLVAALEDATLAEGMPQTASAEQRQKIPHQVFMAAVRRRLPVQPHVPSLAAYLHLSPEALKSALPQLFQPTPSASAPCLLDGLLAALNHWRTAFQANVTVEVVQHYMAQRAEQRKKAAAGPQTEQAAPAPAPSRDESAGVDSEAILFARTLAEHVLRVTSAQDRDGLQALLSQLGLAMPWLFKGPASPAFPLAQRQGRTPRHQLSDLFGAHCESHLLLASHCMAARGYAAGSLAPVPPVDMATLSTQAILVGLLQAVQLAFQAGTNWIRVAVGAHFEATRQHASPAPCTPVGTPAPPALHTPSPRPADSPPSDGSGGSPRARRHSPSGRGGFRGRGAPPRGGARGGRGGRFGRSPRPVSPADLSGPSSPEPVENDEEDEDNDDSEKLDLATDGSGGESDSGRSLTPAAAALVAAAAAPAPGPAATAAPASPAALDVCTGRVLAPELVAGILGGVLPLMYHPAIEAASEPAHSLLCSLLGASTLTHVAVRRLLSNTLGLFEFLLENVASAPRSGAHLVVSPATRALLDVIVARQCMAVCDLLRDQALQPAVRAHFGAGRPELVPEPELVEMAGVRPEPITRLVQMVRWAAGEAPVPTGSAPSSTMFARPTSSLRSLGVSQSGAPVTVLPPTEAVLRLLGELAQAEPACQQALSRHLLGLAHHELVGFLQLALGSAASDATFQAGLAFLTSLLPFVRSAPPPASSPSPLEAPAREIGGAVLDALLSHLPALFAQWQGVSTGPVAMFLFTQQLALHLRRAPDVLRALISALEHTFPAGPHASFATPSLSPQLGFRGPVAAAAAVAAPASAAALGENQLRGLSVLLSALRGLLHAAGLSRAGPEPVGKSLSQQSIGATPAETLAAGGAEDDGSGEEADDSGLVSGADEEDEEQREPREDGARVARRAPQSGSDGEEQSGKEASDSGADAERQALCTVTVTGPGNSAEQHCYFCYTCAAALGRNPYLICSICARTCHRGHALAYGGQRRCTCLCGERSARQAAGEKVPKEAALLPPCQCLKPRPVAPKKPAGGPAAGGAPIALRRTITVLRDSESEGSDTEAGRTARAARRGTARPPRREGEPAQGRR
ncbi:hypothetical protein PAPYR_8638 [Paratrimastix pyriformis]|uniref:UBR-type domain-containing protein n=1 Tax=Paratrimastix pyriformis TaxID=342808 RepID=A0ABQ8UDN7_9EUKA|nr:hypothetical protein PAPYR_8638 [Paratrimastix pyriformis]